MICSRVCIKLVSDNHLSPSIAHTILEGIGACSGWGYGMFSHINLSDTSSTRLIIVSGSSFAYTASVVFVELCPRTFDTVSISTPALRRSVPQVWREQWKASSKANDFGIE